MTNKFIMFAVFFALFVYIVSAVPSQDKEGGKKAMKVNTDSSPELYDKLKSIMNKTKQKRETVTDEDTEIDKKKSENDSTEESSTDNDSDEEEDEKNDEDLSKTKTKDSEIDQELEELLSLRRRRDIRRDRSALTTESDDKEHGIYNDEGDDDDRKKRHAAGNRQNDIENVQNKCVETSTENKSRPRREPDIEAILNGSEDDDNDKHDNVRRKRNANDEHNKFNVNESRSKRDSINDDEEDDGDEEEDDDDNDDDDNDELSSRLVRDVNEVKHKGDNNFELLREKRYVEDDDFEFRKRREVGNDDADENVNEVILRRKRGADVVNDDDFKIRKKREDEDDDDDDDNDDENDDSFLRRKREVHDDESDDNSQGYDDIKLKRETVKRDLKQNRQVTDSPSPSTLLGLLKGNPSEITNEENANADGGSSSMRYKRKTLGHETRDNDTDDVVANHADDLLPSENLPSIEDDLSQNLPNQNHTAIHVHEKSNYEINENEKTPGKSAQLVDLNPPTSPVTVNKNETQNNKTLGGATSGPITLQDKLEKEYLPLFTTNPQKEMKWQEPKVLQNCWAQAMLAIKYGFSPSCHGDGSFTPKQCYLERCWCVHKDGSPQDPNMKTRFLYKLDGIMMSCSQNP